ncbi:MAG: hypothetical protein QOE76_2744, partial [Frankiales bacterium]|nr:hypothetical protein [Frankiales bacterium]
MHARTKSGLRSAAVTAALLAVTGALPATALASGPTSAAQVSATLLLRSPDARGTEALAATTGLSRTERMRRLATTLPLAATKTAARAAVGALGLTVDNATPWSLVVHGP